MWAILYEQNTHPQVFNGEIGEVISAWRVANKGDSVTVRFEASGDMVRIDTAYISCIAVEVEEL